MRASIPLTIMLSLVLAVQALRYNSRVTPEALRLNLKNFLISNVYASSYANSPDSSWNRTLNFLFTDPNSNTSTICSQSWTQTNTTSNLPYNWVLCDYTGIDEAFQWHFSSYQSIKQFQIEFMHGWNDYDDFDPPYAWVGMFSTENTFNLTCAEGNGAQGCNLHESDAPHRAVVNTLTN